MRIRGDEGFTLVELILVIMVLAIGITGVAVYFTQGAYNSSQAQLTAIAVTLAQDLMEEIRSKCWDETATTSLPCNGAVTPSAVLGPDGGEPRVTFDDVDDYNGLVNTPPQDSQGNPLASYALYTRSVTVCYVNSGVLDTCVAGPTPYKRVLVTVAWGGAGDQVQLVTVFSNH